MNDENIKTKIYVGEKKIAIDAHTETSIAIAICSKTTTLFQKVSNLLKTTI